MLVKRSQHASRRYFGGIETVSVAHMTDSVIALYKCHGNGWKLIGDLETVVVHPNYSEVCLNPPT